MISSVKLKDIYKQYPSSNFSLNIDDLKLNNQSVQVIVGPNGSGKSTILRLLAFLEKPDRGDLFLDENRILYSGNDKERLRARIGFVQQSPYLFNISVFENVALGLKIRRYSRKDISLKVNVALGRLRIEDLKMRRVRSLSRGEYQKVAIAQVLVLEPEIILMDEPAASVDAHSTICIEEVVKGIQRRTNSIVIMTTHSLTQAYRVSPEIISMREGRIVDFIHENVFFGEIQEAAGGLKSINVHKDIDIVFSSDQGGKTHIAIDPENIIISKSRIKTSARNAFNGKIVKMESIGPNIRLLIDIGVPMYSIITKQSFEEMGMNLGFEVCVSFKVNSVQVI
ncbi:ATP-binding cassette domain-containing protein [Candidatus Omnitrophota bacterium]